MMPDWNAYLGQLRARIKEMSQLAPSAVAGFNELKTGANNTPHLDVKTRELIAIAIAVTTRCDGCIGVHTEGAIKAGATREVIAEALGVAIALNAGAALTYSARVLDAYAAINSQPEESRQPLAPGAVESAREHQSRTPRVDAFMAEIEESRKSEESPNIAPGAAESLRPLSRFEALLAEIEKSQKSRENLDTASGAAKSLRPLSRFEALLAEIEKSQKLGESPQPSPATVEGYQPLTHLQSILGQSSEPEVSPQPAPRADKSGKKGRRGPRLTFPTSSDQLPEPSNPPKTEDKRGRKR
jgi:AhpD family alkylhydroperoxidase